MKETSKSHYLRLQRDDYKTFINGKVLDIGCGNDPVVPLDGITTSWDKKDGDGQFLASVDSKTFDCVYSSHSLEHMVDIPVTLYNWTRVLKDGGSMFIIVPDFDLYEKCFFPSKWNSDHKHTFSINRTRSEVGRTNHWCIQEDLFKIFQKNNLKVRDIRLEDTNFDYNNFYRPEQDSTMYQIVIACKKNTRV